MGKIRRAIGLMSGTSMDAIDVALIETDGESLVARLHNDSFSINPKLRELLVRAADEAAKMTNAGERLLRPGCLRDAELEVTRCHIAALEQFLVEQDLKAEEIDIIGFHGQTVLHRPEHALTVQLGDGAALARETGIDVIYDLRAADCAAGGQGAPLAPVYHRALAMGLGDLTSLHEGDGRADDRFKAPRSVVFVNIGGVANITIVAADFTIQAFDTGPGNGLIDDWIMSHTGRPIDVGGKIAACGKVDQDALARMLGHDYFAATPPKSLDRNQFSTSAIADLSLEDGAATLCAFTAKSVARARAFMADEPALWIVCGGGRFNLTMMNMLGVQVASDVVPCEAVGLDGDAIEAQAFAYLAVRALNAQALTFPATTGIMAPLTGGVLARADGS